MNNCGREGITLHKSTRRKVALKNLVLRYSWQTDNNVWRLSTVHSTHCSSFITQHTCTKDRTTMLMKFMTNHSRCKSRVLLANYFIMNIRWDNTAIINAISAGTHLMSLWLTLVPHKDGKILFKYWTACISQTYTCPKHYTWHTRLILVPNITCGTNLKSKSCCELRSSSAS